MTYTSPEHHPAFEEYSEAIFELAEDGIAVIQARIAERLEISRPAVSEMVSRMVDEGLVTIDGSGVISLTDAGRKIATTVVRRHRLAERVLTDILGLGWAVAHHEAGKWEHVITPEVERAMIRTLNDPDTCPHGNPIPGSAYEQPDNARVLADVSIGARFIVRRIPEVLEFVDGQLEFLETSGCMPGRQGELLSRSPDGALTVKFDEGTVALGAYTVSLVLVTPA